MQIYIYTYTDTHLHKCILFLIPFMSTYLSYLPVVLGPLAFDLLLAPFLFSIEYHW